MEWDELVELQYITPISNVVSILKRGLLSHNESVKIQHDSVSDQYVQDIRATKVVPGGKRLHDYVNLYFCARNPMMYVRKHKHENLCVLSISKDVLDVSGVVVVDGNASSRYVRFNPGRKGLRFIDREATFAEDWNDPFPIKHLQNKTAKCAEVLIPGRIPSKYIHKAYVSCDKSYDRMVAMDTGLEIVVDAHLFFL